MKKILYSPGEPSGIGPDLIIQMCASTLWSKIKTPIVCLSDPKLIEDRAKSLSKKIRFCGGIGGRFCVAVELVDAGASESIAAGWFWGCDVWVVDGYDFWFASVSVFRGDCASGFGVV